MQHEDDYFHPTNQRDQVIDVRGKDKTKSFIRITAPVPSTPSKRGVGLDDLLSENKNLCVFHLPMENSRKKYVVKCFKSGGMNTPIINAITGMQTRHLVGSANESLYFKVRDTVNSIGNTFYYESPDSYERHMNKVLPIETKARWSAAQ